MSTINPVPSLTEEGWLTAPAAMAGQIFAYFLESNFSQTNQYFGDISSLPYIIQQYGSRPTELTNAVQSALTKLFTRHFTTETNSSNVNVSVTHNADEDISRYNFTVDLSWTVNNIPYQLGRVVSLENSTVKKVIDLYNQ